MSATRMLVFPGLRGILLAGLLLCPQFAFAQLGAVGGVYIDAEGTLKELSTLSQDEQLKLLREAATLNPSSPDIAAASPLRKVSLRRLEAQVQECHQQGKQLPADMKFLAGLERIQYVLIYPEQQDVILAGPASGWKLTPTGEFVSTKTGHPVLQLEDLIVALRYSFAEQKTVGFIGCSIEPTAEGMQNYAKFLSQLGGIDRTRIPQIFAAMEQAMGPQDIELYGIPSSSQFALKMVAADYRLKRIALGHDPSPVKGVVNYLDLQAKKLNPSAPQKQHRWWFTADYEALEHTPDKLAWEFKGQGVKVVTAPTFPGTVKEAKPSPAAQQFATSFSRHFPEMAERVPVFADLRNLMDLTLVAEILAQREDQGWNAAHFLDPQTCPLSKHAVPKQVPSISNYRLVDGRHWLISVSGGVELNPRSVLSNQTRPSDNQELPTAYRTFRQPAQPQSWWWD